MSYSTPAALLHEFGDPFSVETVTLSRPIGREVLVEVRAAGLCHSDLHFTRSDFGFPRPFILGHEISGVVREVGDLVTDVAVGDHVVASLIQACGTCAACEAGETYRCENPDATMRDAQQPARITGKDGAVFGAMGLGGFAALALIDERQLAQIDDRVPFPEAALLGCATITGAGAVLNGSGVLPGQTVAVIGLGGVGLNVVSGARLAGASRIIAIDTVAGKLELARRFGATDVVQAGTGSTEEMVRELLGRGVDHAFEVIGLPQTSQQAIAMLAPGGTAHLIGIHDPGRPLEIDANRLIREHLNVRGVFMGSSNLRRDVARYADLFLAGELNLSDLISDEISLSEINEGYARIGTGSAARSVITSFE